MRFWHYFRVLRAHRVVALSVVVFATAVAAVIMYVYPIYPTSRYESEARLLVTPPGYEATQLSAEPRPWNYGVNQDEIFTTTVAEMLKSESVLNLAAGSLPEGEKRALSQTLEVEPIKAPKQGVELLTHVIKIRSRALSPEQAQSNTDALLAAFIEFHGETALAQAKKERQLIATEMETARARFVDARATLAAFKTESGFIDLERDAATLTNRYLLLQNDLIASEAGLSDMGSSKERATRSVMEQTMELIRQLPAQEARLAELTIAADVADDSYRLLNTKLLVADVTMSINTAAGQVSIMDGASLAELPVSYYEPGGALAFIPPFDYRKALVLLAVVVLSTALAATWVLVTDALDDRIRSGHAAVRLTGLPLLGDIPALRTANGRAAAARGSSAYRESYSAAAARIVNYLVGGGKPVIAVVGAKTREGRTTVVSELARALANAGMTVAMVDADMRSGELSRQFGAESDSGLEAAVFGSTAASATLLDTEHEGVRLVPAGSVGMPPVTMVNSASFGEYLRRLTSEVDVVLVDTPPAVAFADATFIVRAADAAIFVIRAGAAPARHVYEDTLQQMMMVNQHFLGVVLVGVEPEDSESTYHLARYQTHRHEPEGAWRPGTTVGDEPSPEHAQT